MKEKSKRQLQVAEEIRRFVATNIDDYIDTHINNDFLTIMKADISKDLGHCKIFFRCKDENRNAYEEYLRACSGEISRAVSNHLRIYARPDVVFVFDDTHILLDEINKVVSRYQDN